MINKKFEIFTEWHWVHELPNVLKALGEEGYSIVSTIPEYHPETEVKVHVIAQRPCLEQPTAKANELLALTEPLMEYLDENHNPHKSIVITSESAEIVESVSMVVKQGCVP